MLLPQEEAEAVNRKQETNQLKANTKLVILVRGAIEAVSDESGWANLGSVGHHIAQQSPEFDPRNYGYGKLSELVLAIGLFDVEERLHGSSRAKGIYIRDKRKK